MSANSDRNINGPGTGKMISNRDYHRRQKPRRQSSRRFRTCGLSKLATRNPARLQGGVA